MGAGLYIIWYVKHVLENCILIVYHQENNKSHIVMLQGVAWFIVALFSCKATFTHLIQLVLGWAFLVSLWMEK